MPYSIVRNDITKVEADAIVNTANPKPTYAGGTDAAIYEAAGREALLEARKKIGAIERGEARETEAFNLKAKHIIHTVGPAWEGGTENEFEILEKCYENSLKLAYELKCKSIAFPLIATGVYGFPKDKALQIALSTIQRFLLEHEMTVILVVFDKASFELSGKLIENIREYVTANYVEEASAAEYGLRGNFSSVSDGLRYSKYYALERARKSKAQNKTGKVNIGSFVTNSDKTFQEKLFEIIDSRGLTGPQVYKHYISKQVYSKIQADKDYHPNKYTAIALSLSLHLTLDETLDLMGRAGWTLSSSNKMDLVVRGCILNGEYVVDNINTIMFDMDLPKLDKIK